MPDMLVKLYGLPDLSAQMKKIERLGIQVRRPNPWEKTALLDWVREHFGPTWTAECETAFTANPPSCFIAVQNDFQDSVAHGF